MGTGWIYAAALSFEPKWPGAANVALLGNGMISSAAGIVTLRRIESDNAVGNHVH